MAVSCKTVRLFKWWELRQSGELPRLNTDSLQDFMLSQRWIWRALFSEMPWSVFCKLCWLLACLDSFSTSKIEVIYSSPRSLLFFNFREFYCAFGIGKPRTEKSDFTLSLSLSLSLTHTRTHARTQARAHTHTRTHTQVLRFIRNVGLTGRKTRWGSTLNLGGHSAFRPTLSTHALQHMWKPVMIQTNSECEESSSPLQLTARTQ
jgi:hypothetical protein